MTATTTIPPTVREAAPARGGWLRRRWPTLAGLALATVMAAGLKSGAELAVILSASAFVYLGAAALQRRSAAWPVFLVSFVVIALTRLVGAAVDPTWVFLALGAGLSIFGLLRGPVGQASGLPHQSIAMVIMGTTALLASVIGPDPAGYLVAAGLLAHAGWDLYHHRTGQVVVRSMAEFCLVLDTLLALAILVVTVVY